MQEPPSEMLESGKYIEPSSRDISSTNWCGKCHSHRPKRAHHCRYCQRFAPSLSLSLPLYNKTKQHEDGRVSLPWWCTAACSCLIIIAPGSTTVRDSFLSVVVVFFFFLIE